MTLDLRRLASAAWTRPSSAGQLGLPCFHTTLSLWTGDCSLISDLRELINPM